MQLNGINIQTKIGADFRTQYGEGNTINGGSTMEQAVNPTAQHHNLGRVNPDTQSEKISEKIAQYFVAQADMMRLYHGISAW